MSWKAHAEQVAGVAPSSLGRMLTRATAWCLNSLVAAGSQEGFLVGTTGLRELRHGGRKNGLLRLRAA